MSHLVYGPRALTFGRKTLVVTGALGFIAFSFAHGQSVTTSTEEESVTELEALQIFGSDEDLLLPMTPRKIQQEQLHIQRTTDVNRALKTVSGVQVREEDGQGLRPNIGLRGTNPDRSKKVALLEDGVLIAPAPYAAPAAYFTPSLSHVSGIDVYKGFASTGIGPNSIGGALNYRSSEVPQEMTSEIRTSAGAFATFSNRLSHGGPHGKGAYLVELARQSSDGFKKIDQGGATGFAKNSVLAKLRFDVSPSKERAHYFELRAGYGNELSHETYLGLTQSDFDESPFRRYSASSQDRMDWEHGKFQINHVYQVSEAILVDTTVYRHQFQRAWYRLDRFRDSSVNLRGILDDPSGSRAVFYDILRGERDSNDIGTGGQLVVANNDREYLSQGIQSKISSFVQWSEWLVKPELFLRLHSDRIKRHHTYDLFEMTEARLQRTDTPTQTDAINSDEAFATTLSLTASIERGPWALTPVLRFERAQFEFSDELATDRDRRRSDQVVVPGLAITRKLGDSWSVRLSRNEAVTLAGLSSQGQEVREEATNHELEVKYRDSFRRQEGQWTLFAMDYRNIAGTCTVSGGCSNSQLDAVFNGGRAKIIGSELGLAKEFVVNKVSFPVRTQVTLIKATFENEFLSQSPEWGAGQVRIGDPLPYVPEAQYSVSFGTRFRKWEQSLVLSHQTRVFDQSVQEGRNEVEGYGIVDWGVQYEFSKNARLAGKIDNVLARRYAVAARPFGFRPGKPQTFSVGFDYRF